MKSLCDLNVLHALAVRDEPLVRGVRSADGFEVLLGNVADVHDTLLADCDFGLGNDQVVGDEVPAEKPAREE